MANINAQTKTNSSAFRSMLEKHTLTGPNFNEWFRVLKLVVRTEKIQDVFETALPPRPVGVRDAPVDPQALAEWTAKYDRYNEVQKKPHGKAKGKGKAKGGQYSYPSKTKKPQPQKKERPLKKKKSGQMVASTSSSMFMIELYAFPKNSWVYDTGYGTHICNTKQGFRGARKLKRGSLYLYVGNGMRAKVEAIGSFDLHLPNGLIIELDNFHYAPTITRGVVSVSRLVNKGFFHCFTDYGLSVSMNNIIYFNAITVNDVYEIDMCDSTLPIVNSTYSISNKKAKSSLDSSYLWHCHLAHIHKKRITKLQKDGILKSTDNEPYDKCESCIYGKMTKKPFSHKTKKVNDVLGLIHTDVCGPLRHVSKKGASYFITFTDDYIRYGYVYLLKHKHEVFETFKVFKNEVE
nr:retrotransposon protein, putative, Ty1-copia subclass [Tanacetum cinerariifolium]